MFLRQEAICVRMTNALENYKDAVAKGKRAYQNRKMKGQSGHLSSLEGFLKDIEIISTVPLGIIEVPIKKIVGTYTDSRRVAFAHNFMPLEMAQSDFKEKWITLCNAHLEEGIRDPIKVYEYMNWYYVLEGNKRVSVLKYFDAWSVSAEVIRLVPKRDEDNVLNTIYYEFLEFFKSTGLTSLWFSKPGRFNRLLRYMEDYNPQTTLGRSRYEHFERYVYYPFRRIFHELGGGELAVTTADAFILYARLYGIPDQINEYDIQVPLRQIMQELESYDHPEMADISMEEHEANIGVLDTLSSLLKKPKVLKVAFIYARDIESSGWTYSHEQGRKHVDEVFGDRIETAYFDNIPENESAYESIKKIAESGYDVIFTTSEVYVKPTLRCALEHPDILFFNCSGNKPYLHLSNYFGRTYEPRFLTGLIAGSLTETDIIGFIASSPSPEVIAGINAFTLGARMVNPRSRVLVTWTDTWNNPEMAMMRGKDLIKRGADIVNNKNSSLSRNDTWSFGIYSMLCKVDLKTGNPKEYLASPIWKWGNYYEKILNNVLNGTYKAVTNIFNNNPKLLNFWWGMASGVIDLYASKTFVPRETLKLVDLMRQMIIRGAFHPFKGPIYDQEGVLRIDHDILPDPDRILKMDWYVEGVEIIDEIE